MSAIYERGVKITLTLRLVKFLVINIIMEKSTKLIRQLLFVASRLQDQFEMNFIDYKLDFDSLFLLCEIHNLYPNGFTLAQLPGNWNKEIIGNKRLINKFIQKKLIEKSEAISAKYCFTCDGRRAVEDFQAFQVVYNADFEDINGADKILLSNLLSRIQAPVVLQAVKQVE